MQGKHIFEYAIIRVVPRVEREEFLNVGVILYCPHKKFLKTKYKLNKEKLSLFADDDLDLEDLEKRMNAFEQICEAKIEAGEIGKLPIASRFRWLTAARSTVVQTSPVHPGLCDNAEETLNKIYEELVK